MLLRKPTSLVRPNASNAIRTKRRLSDDYKPPAKTHKVSVPPRRSRIMLPREAFSHFVAHGNHTPMADIVRTATRKKKSLIAWFERVSQLRWDNIAQRFRGKVDTARLSIKAAAGVPITRNFTYKNPRSITPGNKCAVCGRPAMPGENTCYFHDPG
jgi:hypothetical protein